METPEQSAEFIEDSTLESSPKKKNNIVVHIMYILIILALIAGVCYFYMQNQSASRSLVICDTSKNSVINERDAMIQRLDSVETQLTQARDQNGQLSQEIEAKLSDIKALKARIYSMKANMDSVTYFRREIESMRKVAVHYLTMIDSLGVANKQLADANNQLSTKVDEQQKVDVEKTKQLEDLSSKVEKAAIMKAGNIVITCINVKSKPVTKAKKVVKIKSTFTILGNALIEKGQKYVYERIIRADGSCLSFDEKNTFVYDNSPILFTEKTEINYQNEDLETTIFYNATDDIIPGAYTVQLFCDGKSIGQTQFTLE